MKYFIARFYKEIPHIEGMALHTSLDSYSIISVTEEGEIELNKLNLSMEEISEDEAITGVKFYGISRDFRKAYSQVEGLIPDEGSLKTTIYHTEATKNAALGLMKKITKRRIVDEFNRRTDQTGKDGILKSVDDCETIWGMNIIREALLGVEIPKYQALEMNLCDDDGNRIDKIDYNKGF
jgi:hypothetical protein